MNRNSLIKIYLLITVIFLSSCDPGYFNTYVINNQSDSNILIYYQIIACQDCDSSILIAPNLEIQIFKNTDLGVASDAGEGFLNSFDSLSIITQQGNDLQKNFNLRENWELELLDGKRFFDGGEAIYTFNILNSDI